MKLIFDDHFLRKHIDSITGITEKKKEILHEVHDLYDCIGTGHPKYISYNLPLQPKGARQQVTNFCSPLSMVSRPTAT